MAGFEVSTEEPVAIDPWMNAVREAGNRSAQELLGQGRAIVHAALQSS
jgi:hypothetical protein